jgi:hypothetical protein
MAIVKQTFWLSDMGYSLDWLTMLSKARAFSNLKTGVVKFARSPKHQEFV